MSEPRAGGSPLTDQEREALERYVGYGLVEIGGPFDEDAHIISACRKLGLNPVDWQGKRMLDD